jgi:hypothetical protein
MGIRNVCAVFDVHVSLKRALRLFKAGSLLEGEPGAHECKHLFDQLESCAERKMALNYFKTIQLSLSESNEPCARFLRAKLMATNHKPGALESLLNLEAQTKFKYTYGEIGKFYFKDPHRKEDAKQWFARGVEVGDPQSLGFVGEKEPTLMIRSAQLGGEFLLRLLERLYYDRKWTMGAIVAAEAILFCPWQTYYCLMLTETFKV